MMGASRPTSRPRRTAVLILAGAAFSVGYALVHAPLPTGAGAGTVPSAIVRAGLLPIAFIVYGAVWFSGLGLVFDRLQPWSDRPAAVRGLGFGGFLTVLVAVLYLEPLPGMDTFGSANLLWMAADALPLLPFGLLVAVLAPFPCPGGSGDPAPAPVRARAGRPAGALLVPVLFIVGRTVGYFGLGIRSDVATRLLATYGWGLAVGAVLAVAFVAFRRSVLGDSAASTAGRFGLVVFGTAYLPFNFAYLLVADIGWTGLADFILRLGVDLLTVLAGVWLAEQVALRPGPSVRAGPARASMARSAVRSSR